MIHCLIRALTRGTLSPIPADFNRAPVWSRDLPGAASALGAEPNVPLPCVKHGNDPSSSCTVRKLKLSLQNDPCQASHSMSTAMACQTPACPTHLRYCAFSSDLSFERRLQKYQLRVSTGMHWQDREWEPVYNISWCTMRDAFREGQPRTPCPGLKRHL